MTRAWMAAALALIALAACNDRPPTAATEPVIEFTGRLTELDRNAVENSWVSLDLIRYRDSVGYDVYSHCRDWGPLNPKTNLYISGDAGPGDTAADVERFCNLDDAKRQRFLKGWMRQGVQITRDAQTETASVIANGNRIAVFQRSGPAESSAAPEL